MPKPNLYLQVSGAAFVVSSGIHDRGAQRMAGALETINLTGDGDDDEETNATAEAEAGRDEEGLAEDPSKKLHSFEIYPAQVCPVTWSIWKLCRACVTG